MRTPRFTDSQILAILKQNEDGVAVQDLCREHSISSATFYKWRAKFWRHGRFIDEAYEGTRGREQATQKRLNGSKPFTYPLDQMST